MILRKLVGATKSHVPCERRPIYHYSFDDGITWVDAMEFVERIAIFDIDQNVKMTNYIE